MTNRWVSSPLMMWRWTIDESTFIPFAFCYTHTTVQQHTWRGGEGIVRSGIMAVREPGGIAALRRRLGQCVTTKRQDVGSRETSLQVICMCCAAMGAFPYFLDPCPLAFPDVTACTLSRSAFIAFVG